MKDCQKKYEANLTSFKAAVAAEKSWQGMMKGYFQSTVSGIGVALGSIPVYLKITSESSDKSTKQIESQVEILKGLLEGIRREDQRLKKFQQDKVDQIRETMSKLTEINASSNNEEEVLGILRVCAKSLAETKENWEALVKFFVDIQNWIEKCTDKVCLLFLIAIRMAVAKAYLS